MQKENPGACLGGGPEVLPTLGGGASRVPRVHVGSQDAEPPEPIVHDSAGPRRLIPQSAQKDENTSAKT